jgi:hypothetical protein
MQAVEWLRHEHDEPIWPLALTTHVIRPGAEELHSTEPSTGATTEIDTTDVFGGEVESSDEEEDKDTADMSDTTILIDPLM